VNLVGGDIPGNTAANILTALQTAVTRLTDGLIDQNKGFEKKGITPVLQLLLDLLHLKYL
jgi:hypothetical protein